KPAAKRRKPQSAVQPARAVMDTRRGSAPLVQPARRAGAATEEADMRIRISEQPAPRPRAATNAERQATYRARHRDAYRAADAARKRATRAKRRLAAVA